MRKLIVVGIGIVLGVWGAVMTLSIAEQNNNRGTPLSTKAPADMVDTSVQKRSSAKPRMVEVEEEMWYRLNQDLLELQDELVKTKAKAKITEAELERTKVQLKEIGKKKGHAQEVHRVQKNENLWKIAKRYYNDPYKWRWIFKENLRQITDPDKVYPEQVLDIPQY